MEVASSKARIIKDIAQSRELMEHADSLLTLPFLKVVSRATTTSKRVLLLTRKSLLPGSKTYTGRAEECRKLANISALEWKAGFLSLAAEYEALAKRSEREGPLTVNLKFAARLKSLG